MQPEERYLQVAVGRQPTDRLQHFLLKWIRLDDVPSAERVLPRRHKTARDIGLRGGLADSSRPSSDRRVGPTFPGRALSLSLHTKKANGLSMLPTTT
jgi:hypothetical protein